jgi:hypothetical protein
MKAYIKLFLPLLIVSVFSGCSATKLSKYDLKEIYSEKHHKNSKTLFGQK